MCDQGVVGGGEKLRLRRNSSRSASMCFSKYTFIRNLEVIAFLTAQGAKMVTRSFLSLECERVEDTSLREGEAKRSKQGRQRAERQPCLHHFKPLHNDFRLDAAALKKSNVSRTRSKVPRACAQSHEFLDSAALHMQALHRQQISPGR